MSTGRSRWHLIIPLTVGLLQACASTPRPAAPQRIPGPPVRTIGITVGKPDSVALSRDDLYLQGVSPPLSRLRVEGRRFRTEDGEIWRWRGVTAFRLVHQVATGHLDEADAYLRWARDHGVTIVRTLAMAWNLFQLAPADGIAALPALLDRAQAYGLYVEVVAAADTGSYAMDLRKHVQQIGAICAIRPACLIEIGNELDPVHPTQDSRLGDVAYVAELRRLIPSTVLVSLGSFNNVATDGGTTYHGGDYATVHEDRSGGDDGWDWVRHRNKTRGLGEHLGKPLVGDEPKRDDLAPDKHLAFGLLASLYGLGDTFHYQGGLSARIPQGDELAAFESRRRGWDAIPSDFVGTYKHAGSVDSPVENADRSTVLDVFSAIRRGDGFTVALDVRGEARIHWSSAWPNRQLRVRDGRTALWHVTR